MKKTPVCPVCGGNLYHREFKTTITLYDYITIDGEVQINTSKHYSEDSSLDSSLSCEECGESNETNNDIEKIRDLLKIYKIS